MKKHLLFEFSLCILALLTVYSPYAWSQAEVKPPNIGIILADDMGYSDMGMFGSEIKTTNLDGIAKEGVCFTNFCTHASCSPSRSMILSGQDTHINGLGAMDEWTVPNQSGVQPFANMEDPDDKGTGLRISLLYEEYRKVVSKV